MTREEKTAKISAAQELLSRAQAKMQAPMAAAPAMSVPVAVYPETAAIDVQDVAREAGEGEVEAVPYLAAARDLLGAVLA